jgi:hypothetical protein
VRLVGGESALLTTRPLTEAPPAEEERVDIRVLRRWISSGQPVVVSTTTGGESLEVVSQWVIGDDGELEMVEGPIAREEAPSEFGLAPLEEMGLREFSGTVRYGLPVYVPRRHVRRRLVLDLGEVGCVAEAWLNGEYLGVRAWPPYGFDITGLVREDANDLTVEVTNTLANQAAREDVVQRAKERGWFNTYYQRVLPWMREGLRSGLIGPVTVRAMSE